jgi:hypothetical protein
MQNDETGMWEGLTYEQYDKLKGLRKTYLWVLVGGTPAEYRWKLAHPETTPAMELGKAVHDAVLCPDLFTAHYIGPPEAPDCPGVLPGKWDLRRKIHKEAWAKFEAGCGEQILMKKKNDWDACLGMRAAVMRHRTAKLLIENAATEVTMQWRDLQTNLLLKARLDIWIDNSDLSDLKSASRGSVTGFGYDAYKYGYPFQLAMYSDGVKAVVGTLPAHCSLIAVESHEPYLVAVYDVEDDVLELGRSQYRQALATVLECERTGEWPGYSQDPMPLVLPSWAGMELDSTWT